MTTAWVHVNCPTCEWMAYKEFPIMEVSEIRPVTGMTECCNEMLCEGHLNAVEARLTCSYCGG